jgi:acetyl esterase/lipase
MLKHVTPILCAAMLTAFAGAAADLTVHRDVVYAEIDGFDPELMSMDIYAPRGAEDLPVVVFVHGGSWQFGNKQPIGDKPEFFADHGFVFISTNYRLSPAVSHPTHVSDVARAVAFVHDHASDYGIDPDRIFIMGHSAGAHLVALLGADDRRLEALSSDPSVIKGVVVLDTAALDMVSRMAALPQQESGMYGAFTRDRQVWRDASVLAHVEDGGGRAPYMIVNAHGAGIKTAATDRIATILRGRGVRVEVFDASRFRSHGTLITKLGDDGDPVGPAIIEFLTSLADPAARVTGLGSTHSPDLDPDALERGRREIAEYQAGIAMRFLDKDKDGRVIREEAAGPLVTTFDEVDLDGDGVVTRDEMIEGYIRLIERQLAD